MHEPQALFRSGDDAWLARLRDAEGSPPLGRLGRYDLREIVSRGGQGVVFRAVDTRTGRTVALKRLIAGDAASPAALRRFEREIETASALRHPGVVTLYSAETLDRQAVLAMEWVDGVPIDEWARRQERSPGEIAGLVLRVADALSHAHQRGVLHRDLKPSNILVDPEDTPRLLDFGLATFFLQDAGTRSVTRTGQFLGTPAWASPEQVRGGAGALDVRSDLYSLGVILYQALTGTMPYRIPDSIAGAFHVIQTTEAERPTRHRPGIPRDLEAIVMRTLEKSPDRRYQSADALAADLRRFLRGDPVEARAHDLPYLLARTVRRHRGPVAASALFVGLLAAFAVTMTVQFRRADAEADRARRAQEFLQATLLPEDTGSGVLDMRLIDVLERAAARIDPELRGHPRMEARLWETLASAYGQLWMWERVEEPARRALALIPDAGPDGDPRATHLLYLLGTALTFAGSGESVSVQAEVLRRRQATEADDSVPVAAAHAAVAFANWRGARPARPTVAETHYREALRRFEAAGEDRSMTHAGARYGFAALLQSTGRTEEAAAMYRSALALYERIPEADIHMLRCLQDYGHLLAESGAPEANAVLRRFVDALPRHHVLPKAAYTVWTLARLRAEDGEAAEAHDLAARSLAMQLELAAEESPSRAEALRALAARVSRDGLPEDAAASVREILSGPGTAWSPALAAYRTF